MDKDPKAALEVLKEYAESMGNELSGHEAHTVLKQVEEATEILADALGLGPQDRPQYDDRFGRLKFIPVHPSKVNRIERWYLGAQDDVQRSDDIAENSHFIGVAMALRSVLELLYDLPITEATPERNEKGFW